ncbi:bifunctional folylpolyglutamate synthase/dihydrofolate synthase [Chryseobacterium sp. MFBS3-17]|uniref:bifunctional folylpolyglutamate synthase/dihydrofolate synthase n=1 Tax=Chryseobacterium sp. MFBS3-17 TaxID=2886689 RepID=UPI001D0E245C|nr:folylpolyglutamate synthase/dihydrofolate synthase family protein [Chryseobacterium sp. MFBS3-17]MCC2591175.1 bifunctional folylpolyglutamate synthase/dihydrofolate synthase [Chryseobacterium sp. MFBS3-17]
MTQAQYQEALEWLFVQMPNYQKDGKKAYKPGLDNIRKLCHYFGNPQDKIRTIHVGGTNGKGSVSNMLASVLQEAGYSVGLYNSPHLVDFTERIRIDGSQCDKEFVFDFIEKLKALPGDIRPSFFEFTTVMAFEYFYRHQVDFAIIEVGLGGRLDATNIIRPLVAAITNVALDHQDILGDTIEAIAREKAGIIKEGVPVVCGDERDVVKSIIRAVAETQQAEYIDATVLDGTLESDLKGQYQHQNKKVVVGLMNALREQGVEIPLGSLEDGLKNVQKNTGFIGRWYQFSEEPLIICDTGHNQAGLEQVFEQLNGIQRFKHIVLGFVNDKKIDEVLTLLPRNAVYYFVKPFINRGRSPQEYEDLLKKAEINYEIFQDVQSGYLSALQTVKNDEMIFIGGSNFVVGDFLEKNLEK